MADQFDPYITLHTRHITILRYFIISSLHVANEQSKERGILGWFSLLQLHVWVLSLDSKSASSFLGIINTI